MNDDQWVVFVHPFENVERKVKTVMDEVRSLVVVCLGLDSLVYRINSSSCTLGRDCELIEQLFWNIVQCADFAVSFIYTSCSAFWKLSFCTQLTVNTLGSIL